MFFRYSIFTGTFVYREHQEHYKCTVLQCNFCTMFCHYIKLSPSRQCYPACYCFQVFLRVPKDSSCRGCCKNSLMSDSRYHVTATNQSHITSPPADNCDRSSRCQNLQWKEVAQILDRLFFAIYFVVLFICFYKYFPLPTDIDSVTRHHLD